MPRRSMMNDRVLFVVPAFDEERNIRKPINDIRKNFENADIIVINDCSMDKTVQVLKELDVNYLDLPVNLGYSGAVQTGIKYANRNDYDYVIQFDGDGQHLAEEAYKLYRAIKDSGVNIVIGSRFLSKTDYEHPFFRRLGTGFFASIIKLVTKQKITDPTSGLQVLDKKTISKYSQPGQYPEFPDANLIAKMILEGYKVEEVSCKMVGRTAGISMHAGVLKPVRYVIRNIYSLLLIGVSEIFKSKPKQRSDDL
jgi:glycosyltransferase involved in cell wall biosynthesis